MFDKLEAAKNRYDELSLLLTDPEVLADSARYNDFAREYASLSEVVSVYVSYKENKALLEEIRELLGENRDRDFHEMLQKEYDSAKDKDAELGRKLKELLDREDPEDNKNVIMEIRAGAGGEEAALFAGVLMRMYSRYAERMGWLFETVYVSDTELGGVKEGVFTISGFKAYSRLKYESGAHRVQRIPATESGGRIHTSTATVAVLPEVSEEEAELNMNDLQIDTFRSGGAGGQHINKTSSAIRITHKPTGIVVTCQDERSQFKNKDKALKVLRAKLYDISRTKLEKQVSETRRSQVGTGDRSEKIRTYNYPQNRVTDHRIGLTLYKLENVLDGELEEITDALITFDKADELSGKGPEDI